MSTRLYIIIIIFSLIGYDAISQIEVIQEAVSLIKSGDLEGARVKIDAAILNESTSGLAKTWYYKGIIYKDLYKQTVNNVPKADPLRATAVEALTKCNKLDNEKVYTESATGNLKYLASKYYNDAANALNKGNVEVSQSYFKCFAEIMKDITLNDELQTKNVEYKLVLGAFYTTSCNNETDENKKAEYLNKAKVCFDEVLSIDPKNLTANYNMGVIYYNEAVNIIAAMQYDIDLIDLGQVEDNSIILFKKSLPYMEAAFELDPENKNTIEGLAGIYFGLKEFDKSTALQKKLDELKQ